MPDTGLDVAGGYQTAIVLKKSVVSIFVANCDVYSSRILLTYSRSCIYVQLFALSDYQT